MLANAFVLALAAAPFVAAHGKIAQVQGDLGGNGTALAIKGAVVPGPGPNKKTEVDTTVFKSKNLMSDGLGRTTGGGNNKLADVAQTMALSGPTMPQVSSSNGTISTTMHCVTTDGAGPFGAVIDPTATGAFSNGVKLQVLQQVPGNNGNIRPDGTVPGKNRNRVRDFLNIFKRASNVNKDFPLSFSVPAGTTCQGKMAGQDNVCLVKVANNNRNGPFGGVFPVQIVANGGAAAAAPAAAATKNTKKVKGGKREVAFEA